MKRAIFIFVTLTTVISALPASAGVASRSERSQISTTATWGVSVVDQNNVIINQDYPLTLIASGNTSYNYFSLRNTGSLSTSFFTISLLQDVIKNKNLKPGDVILTPNNNQSIGFLLQVLVPRSSVRGGQVTHL